MKFSICALWILRRCAVQAFSRCVRLILGWDIQETFQLKTYLASPKNLALFISPTRVELLWWDPWRHILASKRIDWCSSHGYRGCGVDRVRTEATGKITSVKLHTKTRLLVRTAWHVTWQSWKLDSANNFFQTSVRFFWDLVLCRAESCHFLSVQAIHRAYTYWVGDPSHSAWRHEA